MHKPVYLVTGALGCIGAWTLYHLVRQGEQVVSFDLSDQRHRLDLLLPPDEQQATTFVRGDLTNASHVLETFQKHHITHIIHLAALQIPFCRAEPAKGAQVNVVGTVNIFEAARQMGISHVTYASSIAIYGPPEVYPPGLIAPDAIPAPGTLYGVYKLADEGIARVYWLDHQITSTTLRAYVIYGLGRDQGLTSEPTKAMQAAATGQPYHISFGGNMQLQWASDVALQFIEAARSPLEGAYGFNLGGEVVSISQVIELIRQVKPDAQITFTDSPLPFPEGYDDAALRYSFAQVFSTPLADGIRHTIQQFES